MKKKIGKLAATAAVLFALNTPVVFAQKGDFMGSGSGHPPMKNQESKMGHGKAMMGHGYGGTNFFGENWKNTLDDTQMIECNKLHLALKRKIKPLSAALEVKLVELNNLVTQDNADKQILRDKIREIIEIKQIIMEEKYAHKIEMRNILNESQKVSFDLGILAGSGKKMH